MLGSVDGCFGGGGSGEFWSFSHRHDLKNLRQKTSHSERCKHAPILTSNTQKSGLTRMQMCARKAVMEERFKLSPIHSNYSCGLRLSKKEREWRG